MLYEYRLAGLRIVCSLPFTLSILDESREFLHLTQTQDDADLVLTVKAAASVKPPQNALQRGCRYYAPGNVWFCTQADAQPFAHVYRCGEKCLQAEYLEEKEQELRYSANLCDLLSIETLLLLQEGFLLHASFLDVGGKALLFSAPSGTGKSTQAALWERYAGARIINGDRAALRRIGEKWHACGIPYAGSSRTCHDASLPCLAIVVLRQAAENRLTRLSVREAVLALYPEMSVHEWEKEQVELAMTHLLRLMQSVPVYRLDCLPDEAAVRLLEKEILP